MAVLPDGDRKTVWARMMQAWSDAREGVAITKTDLRAAVDAADAWADSNAASFNAALPAAARNGLTAKQKAAILMYVVARRWEVN